jgi:homoserine O-acetyltransferase
MNADANDFVWAWASSGDYDPSPDMEKIQAHLLAVNAADDERNPPETGLMDAAMKRVRNGRLHLIPASEQTAGHLTTGSARHYKAQLEELLRTAPVR